MPREVITDLKVVYYRGRYWAATVWSKVGRTSTADSPPIMEVDGSGKEEAAKRRRMTGSSLKPVT